MTDTETEVNATPAALDFAEEHGVDLSEVEGSGQGGRITVDDVKALLVVEEEPEVELESVEGHVPVVHAGMWVRLNPRAIPAHMVNRDLSVLQAATHRTNGPSNLSHDNVEYQLPSDPLLVRNRDTGEEFNVTRGQVEKYADDRAAFGGR